MMWVMSFYALQVLFMPVDNEQQMEHNIHAEMIVVLGKICWDTSLMFAAHCLGLAHRLPVCLKHVVFSVCALTLNQLPQHAHVWK